MSDTKHVDLKARLEFLELSMSAAGIGTFEWDVVTDELLWDARLIELFDYQSHEFGGTIASFNNRLHPEDRDRVAAELSLAISSCGDFKSEYRLLLDSGSVRWISARGRVLTDAAGVPARMLGAAWDYTDRAEGESRVIQVMESLSTAFFSIDEHWRFTYANAAAEHVLGLPRSALLGGDLWTLFPAAVDSEFESNYRRAMANGESVAFDAFYPAPLNRWFEVRAVRIDDGLGVYFVDVTARHEAQLEAERAARRGNLLSRITEELAGTADYETAAKRLSALAVPVLADWCLVSLTKDTAAVGSRRGMRTIVVLHSDEKMQLVADEYAALGLEALGDDSVIIRSMQSAKPQFIEKDAINALNPTITNDRARELISLLAPESVAVFPLRGRSGTVGILTLCNGAERGQFTDEDVVTATHVAARAGVVMDNARLYRQQLELAEGLQRSLLTEPPEPDHLQVAVRYTPASEVAQVGGDWYDAFVQPQGATVLVIGDVVGHDTASAAAMSQVRTLLRGIGALADDGPATVLMKMDRLLETLRVDTVASVIVARLEQSDEERSKGLSRFRWSNAGHPPPMVLTEDGAATALMPAGPDTLLGVMRDRERSEYEVVLSRNARVLMYTDGLVERRGQSLDQGLSSLQRVMQTLFSVPLEEMCDRILNDMLPSSPEDDVALVAVHLHPQDEPRPSA